MIDADTRSVAVTVLAMTSVQGVVLHSVGRERRTHLDPPPIAADNPVVEQVAPSQVINAYRNISAVIDPVVLHEGVRGAERERIWSRKQVIQRNAPCAVLEYIVVNDGSRIIVHLDETLLRLI